MELLISFFVILGLFGSAEEAQEVPEFELEEIRIQNHLELADQFGDEYTSIFGWDEDEVE